MAHECEDCGESFETLTRLRTHDCGGTGGVSGSASSFGGASDVDIASDAETATSSSTTGRNASVPELDDQIERVSDGEFGAVIAAVATFESAQSSALDAGDSGDTYRDVFWSYYEPVADRLDAATRSEGWGPTTTGRAPRGTGTGTRNSTTRSNWTNRSNSVSGTS